MDRIVEKIAPAFKVQAVLGDGKEIKKISLEDYKGSWIIMLFYTLDFTKVCHTELRGFSDRYKEFQNLGADILAISCDSLYSHKTWIRGKLGEINFPIVSDYTKEITKNFGVLIEEEGIPLRGLFIIDPEGKIKYSVIHDLDIGRNVDEILRVLQALKSGGMCPLNWRQGDENL
ncbi:thioredoxin peroxidase [Clostridiaceae bacterium 14S0207]|nr:thioredoxin peroxidase [Clostridiaceae bacterium 14S0207]